jgi:hypothetical protein
VEVIGRTSRARLRRPGVVHALPTLSKPAPPRGRARPRRPEVGSITPNSRPARQSPPSTRPALTLLGSRLLWPELAAQVLAGDGRVVGQHQRKRKNLTSGYDR